jgi:formylmethanofuran dehydrogenase subunit D
MSKFIGKGVFSPGSTSECSLNFVDSVNTGIYESATGTLNLVAGGTSYMAISTSILIQGQINMGSNRITGLPLSLSANTTDAASVQYVLNTVGSSFTAGNGISITSGVIAVVAANASITVSGSGIYVPSSTTANQVWLSSGTATTAPTWGAVPLGNSNSVTGTLAVGNGGTGATTFASNGILIGNTTSAVQVSSTTLNAAGTLTMAGAFMATYRNVATAVTINATDYLLTVTNTAAIAITLTAVASNVGRVLVIVKLGTTLAGTVTITPNGTDPINGVASATIILTTQYSRAMLICDGVSWYSL